MDRWWKCDTNFRRAQHFRAHSPRTCGKMKRNKRVTTECCFHGCLFDACSGQGKEEEANHLPWYFRRIIIKANGSRAAENGRWGENEGRSRTNQRKKYLGPVLLLLLPPRAVHQHATGLRATNGALVADERDQWFWVLIKWWWWWLDDYGSGAEARKDPSADSMERYLRMRVTNGEHLDNRGREEKRLRGVDRGGGPRGWTEGVAT